MVGEGDLNTSARALSAVSVDMSNVTLSSLLRDTWQYGQECSHRRETTNMCNPVKSASRRSLVRTLSGSSSIAIVESSSTIKCLDFKSLYVEVVAANW